jgi:hypothetical protein
MGRFGRVDLTQCANTPLGDSHNNKSADAGTLDEGRSSPLIGGIGLRGQKTPKEIPMATSSGEQHDYITGSVAGLLTLFIIVVGLVLMAAWFYGY